MVTYVYLDYPLESIHPFAFKIAEAVHCAAQQGSFWEMHDRLFANQKALSPVQRRTHAEVVGLDLSRFDACLEEEQHAAESRKDMTAAAKAGVRAIPSFGIGFTDLEDLDKAKVVQVLRGALPFKFFKSAIDGLLSQ